MVCSLAEHDVQYIESLSQAEIIEFFDRYISPDSASRSKLTVCLRAQSSAAGLAKDVPSDALKEKMLQLLEHFLQSEGHVDKSEKIQQRLDGLEIHPANQRAIFSAIEQYLRNDLSLEDHRAKAVLEKGQTMMSALWFSAGVKPDEQQGIDSMAADDDSKRPAKKASIPIESIYEFRAKLPLTAGAQPLRDLSEFEEVTPRL